MANVVGSSPEIHPVPPLAPQFAAPGSGTARVPACPEPPLGAADLLADDALFHQLRSIGCSERPPVAPTRHGHSRQRPHVVQNQLLTADSPPAERGSPPAVLKDKQSRHIITQVHSTECDVP